MKDVFAIVPVKPLEDGKSRLRAILTDRERMQLNEFLMTRTFEQACIFPGASRTIVVSKSETVLAVAESRGMIVLLQRAGGLNDALSSATQEAMSRNAGGVMILPVDLPLANIAALKCLIEQCSAPVCMIAPDRHRTGTNLLCVSPVHHDLYRFGPDSFRSHQAEAAKRNMRIVLLEDETLGIDIDDSADYRLWLSRLEPTPIQP